jgi:hypothetical protein
MKVQWRFQNDHGTQNTSLHTTTQKKAQNFNSKPSQIVKEPRHFIQIPKLWYEEEKKSQNLMMKLKDYNIKLQENALRLLVTTCIGFLCQKLYSTMQNGFAMHHTLQNDSSTKKRKEKKVNHFANKHKCTFPF